MAITPVKLSLLNTVFTRLELRGIPYKLGGKIPLDADTSDPRIADGVDCSGFVRYALYKATSGGLDMGDGSVEQHDWCRKAGLHKLAKYADVTQADPSRLFIAFIEPDPVGHVWLIHRAQSADGQAQQEAPSTMESHGHHGVGSRPWNTRILLTEVAECFELPATG